VELITRALPERPSRAVVFSLGFVSFLACAPPSPAEVEVPARAQQVLEAINELRAGRGVEPLALSPALSGFATERAELAARSGSLTTGNGDDQIARAKEAGYEAWLLSAIVAQAAGTGEEVVEVWRRDAAETFFEALNPKFGDVGVGVAEPRDGQPPIYVVVLGYSWRDYFTERTKPLADRAAVRSELFAGLNQLRAENRAPRLRSSRSLDRVAQDYADKMLRESFYDHTAPDGSTVLERVRSTGYTFTSVGENIALGQFEPSEVIEGWADSPGHRRNMLDRDFREVGHGVAFGHNANGWEVLWVQVFATPAE
jgi:uncharacterized protein YkwD